MKKGIFFLSVIILSFHNDFIGKDKFAKFFSINSVIFFLTTRFLRLAILSNLFNSFSGTLKNFLWQEIKIVEGFKQFCS